MSKYSQKERNGLYELTDSARAELSSSKYYNEDLAPTTIAQRTWTTYHITSLWVTMAICIPALTMASGLVELGLSPWLAVFNVALGNLIVLIPIQLNSHAGTKYGIPFPVFARLTFGSVGAHIPSVSRGITACGWCAIQSWIGGMAIVGMVAAFFPAFKAMPSANFIGFGIFLFLVFIVAYQGAEGIKWMQVLASPLLVALLLLLIVWSTRLALSDGFTIGNILNASTDKALVDSQGGGLYIFLAGLTGNIAFWATMALNIPDFSRYAQSQRAQFRGQLYGMPITMAFCAFVGAYFAQATKLAFGVAIFNPAEVIGMLDNRFFEFIVGFGVVIATLTTNITANVVAPANGFSNLSPRRISYRVGIVMTIIIAIAFRPWWIMGGAGSYIFGWLNNYGAVLAPIAAIFIADYYLVKKRNLSVKELFQGSEGRYWYSNGWNINALIAWVCGFLPPLLGGTVLNKYIAMKWLAANGYFFGFIVGLGVYVLLMSSDTRSIVSDKEMLSLTQKDTQVS